MALSVDPEELETEAGAIEGLAGQFGDLLDDRQTAIEGIEGWDGDAREAFQQLFQEARTQMRDVEDQINNIAGLLRAAKDGLLEQDEMIAAGIRNG